MPLSDDQISAIKATVPVVKVRLHNEPYDILHTFITLFGRNMAIR